MVPTALYKSYNELDFEEIKRIKMQCIDKEERIDSISIRALITCFHGFSIFTIFEGQLKMYKNILEVLEEKFDETQSSSCSEDEEHQ